MGIAFLVKCKKCGHISKPFDAPCPIDEAITASKNAKCPQCGSIELFATQNPDDIRKYELDQKDNGFGAAG